MTTLTSRDPRPKFAHSLWLITANDFKVGHWWALNTHIDRTENNKVNTNRVGCFIMSRHVHLLCLHIVFFVLNPVSNRDTFSTLPQPITAIAAGDLYQQREELRHKQYNPIEIKCCTTLLSYAVFWHKRSKQHLSGKSSVAQKPLGNKLWEELWNLFLDFTVRSLSYNAL